MISIRRYLVTLLIAFLTLTSFLAALQSYRESSAQAQRLFDEDLKALAASVLAPYLQTNTELAVDFNTANAIQLWQGNTLLYHSAQTPSTALSLEDGYSEQNFAGKRWQTFRQTNADFTVIVAQPLQDRLALSDQVVLASIYPVVLSLPVQALLIWLLVGRGLRPLLELARQLTQKKADDLTPLTLEQTPQELDQMLSSTNQLLARLDDAFAREKRFAADVAHELRTPLAVLQVNLHNAQQRWKEAGVSDPDQIMVALQDGVRRMSALIEQIMLLNRTNPAHFSAQLQSLDLASLCREVVAELYPQIELRQQQIALDGEDSVRLDGDAFALKLLLLNLVGNASKYTPDGGQIQLLLARSAQTVSLIVEDSGPGIAPEEYQRVFERFYRVGGDRHQSGQPGSGLGLAIVRDIALLHQGSLTLGRSALGGLCVKLELPLCSHRD
jgi:two-component system sensor histidine kinase QseC